MNQEQEFVCRELLSVTVQRFLETLDGNKLTLEQITSIIAGFVASVLMNMLLADGGRDDEKARMEVRDEYNALIVVICQTLLHSDVYSKEWRYKDWDESAN